MKLATTTGDFLPYAGSQAEALKHIRAAGFRYADYLFGYDYKSGTGIFGGDPRAHMKEVAQRADQLGMKLIQAHSPMGKPLAADNAQFIADTIRCVEACGQWGIPNLVVHSGYVRGLSKEENFQQNKAFFLPVLASAEKYGVTILVENFNKMHIEGLYWVDNAPDLLAIVEYVDHPLFQAVWDAGHANMQDRPQDEELRMLGSHLRGLHIHDNMGDADTHQMPYFGTLNLDAVMNGLLDIGYNGYFTFEVRGILAPTVEKRQYQRDDRVANAPLSLRIAGERYLYELGKCVLEAYGCFEE